MSNHIEQAKQSLKDVPDGILRGNVEGEIDLAKANALIAIAEQLRIANLISLMNSDNIGGPGNQAWEELHEKKPSRFGGEQLPVDIAEALGIGGGSDD
ncbi:hypothetical protein BPY_07030 [Bifidobacterium psychraerophilum]|uniref:hypothetical protein n=1 Tax=Bifidobacterium psychraerophilum TaxID=218140 RepID=UPI00311816A7